MSQTTLVIRNDIYFYHADMFLVPTSLVCDLSDVIYFSKNYLRTNPPSSAALFVTSSKNYCLVYEARVLSRRQVIFQSLYTTQPYISSNLL